VFTKFFFVSIYQRIALFFCICVFLAGCGYRWSSIDAQRSIRVPYVAGDQDGALTAEIVRQLCSAPHIRVSSDASDRLDIAIVQDSFDPIGYRRDPQKVDGKIRKNLSANEERKTISVDVSLFHGDEAKPVFGPQRLSAFVDYDYIDGDSIQDLEFQNSSGQTVVVLPFSLGQLEPQEAAQEAANRPLYEKISQKIVDAVTSLW
jgi:hypothetical protein